MAPLRYLIDKSALSRTTAVEVRERLDHPIRAGLVGISIATELEVGYSARSAEDYRRIRAAVVDRLVPVPMPLRAEQRAREVQAALVGRGQHRAVSIPDLLIAATAEVEQLVVLHYDADFDRIAEVTGQTMEWVVPRGSID